MNKEDIWHSFLELVSTIAKICIVGWRSNLNKLRRRNKQWFVWSLICIFISIVLWQPLLADAFKIGFLFGLSYLWATIVAFGTGLILKTPYLLIMIYIGMIVGDAFGGLKDEGIRQLFGGNIMGAIILIGMSIYLMSWADKIKNGDL